MHPLALHPQLVIQLGAVGDVSRDEPLAQLLEAEQAFLPAAVELGELRPESAIEVARDLIGLEGAARGLEQAEARLKVVGVVDGDPHLVEAGLLSLHRHREGSRRRGVERQGAGDGCVRGAKPTNQLVLLHRLHRPGLGACIGLRAERDGPAGALRRERCPDGLERIEDRAVRGAEYRPTGVGHGPGGGREDRLSAPRV